MKYKCDRCNEYKEMLDNMTMVGVGLAKYVEELESQRRQLKDQLKREVEEKINLRNELAKKK